MRLGQVADVRIVRDAGVDRARRGVRRIDVEADVSGRSIGTSQNDIENRLADLNFPLEYHAKVLSRRRQEIDTGQMLAFGSPPDRDLPAAAGRIRSWRLAAMVFLTLPVAFAGGVAAALIDGAELSLGSMVGFLALFALAARNGMLLIRRFQDLERRRARPSGRLVKRGRAGAARADLTTTGRSRCWRCRSSSLGSRPGLEIVHPMAVVILGGLVTTRPEPVRAAGAVPAIRGRAVSRT